MKNIFEQAKEKGEKSKSDYSNMPFKEMLAHLYVNESSQSWSTTIQTRVIEIFKLTEVAAKIGRGDFKVTIEDGIVIVNYRVSKEKYGEFKVSFCSTKKKWNLVQLRPHEEFDYYLFLLVDLSEHCKYEWFLIEKEAFHSHKDIKLNLAHGNKKNQQSNEMPEYRISFTKYCKNPKVYNALVSLNLIKKNQIN